MEDDLKRKEDDQNGVDDDVNQVLTILTPPRRGHGDLIESPGMGQEEGEDDRNVPDNVTSSTTSSGWVEGSTITSTSRGCRRVLVLCGQKFHCRNGVPGQQG